MKEHFKNSKFPCEADEYMPVIFSPPRDGLRLTDPVPIICKANITAVSRSSTNRTCTSSSPAVSSKEDEDEEEEEEGTSENCSGEIEFGNFRGGVIINGHVNAGRRDNGKNDDVDGSSSNGGDSGGYRQYYDDVDDDDDDDDGRSERLTL